MPRIRSALVGGPKVGEEIFYDEKTSNQTTLSTVTEDVADLDPVTFTVRPGEVYEVEAFVPYGSATAAGAIGNLHITDAANVIKASSASSFSGVNHTDRMLTRERIATPGTYTRKVRMFAQAGNVSIFGAVNNATAATFRVRRVK